MTTAWRTRPLRVVVQSPDPLLRELLGDWLSRHPWVSTVALTPDHAAPSDPRAPSLADALIVDATEPEPGSAQRDAAQSDTARSDTGAASTETTSADATRAAAPLTARELEVLRLLSLGHRSLEIGSALGVSAHTVENHKRRIFAKLGARNETQAVADAIRRGLVSRPTAGHTTRLTPRESEIIDLAAAGNSVKQTARALNISVKTVESIQSHLFRKLGVSGRTGAVAAVYGRNGHEERDESSDASGR